MTLKIEKIINFHNGRVIHESSWNNNNFDYSDSYAKINGNFYEYSDLVSIVGKDANGVLNEIKQDHLDGFKKEEGYNYLYSIKIV